MLASADQTTHAYDSFASDYLTGFQQKLSDEAEAFVQVAEQIALYRAADGRFDWSSFNTSDAAQAAGARGFPGGPPGFERHRQAVAVASRRHRTHLLHRDSCAGTARTGVHIDVHRLTEWCSTQLARSRRPEHQCASRALGRICSGRVDERRRARGRPPPPGRSGGSRRSRWRRADTGVASVNPQAETRSSWFPSTATTTATLRREGTTTVLFGSFNNVEGSLGIGALGANRTYSGGGDNDLHNFTVTPSTFYTQMNLVYKEAQKYGTSNWYEYIKIKVPDHAVFGAYARVRVFWPSQVEIAFGDYSITSASGCTDYYYHDVRAVAEDDPGQRQREVGRRSAVEQLRDQQPRLRPLQLLEPGPQRQHDAGLGRRHAGSQRDLHAASALRRQICGYYYGGYLCGRDPPAEVTSPGTCSTRPSSWSSERCAPDRS